MSRISRMRSPRALSTRLAVAVLCGATTLTLHAARTAEAAFAPPSVCVAPAASTAASEPSGAAKAGADKRFTGDAFIRTELYFGSERPDLPEVSAEEFRQFLDEAVTPCFPDGLTLLTGKGQFRESGGQIVQETSFVLVLLYPLETRKESNLKIEALRALYKDAFLQESVLRVDDPRAARVGF